MDYQSVLSEVESWPVDDRIRFVQDVWDNLIDSGYQPELTDEMKAELDRRADELDRNPGSGVPWEEVRAKTIGRFRKRMRTDDSSGRVQEVGNSDTLNSSPQ